MSCRYQADKTGQRMTGASGCPGAGEAVLTISPRLSARGVLIGYVASKVDEPREDYLLAENMPYEEVESVLRWFGDDVGTPAQGKLLDTFTPVIDQKVWGTSLSTLRRNALARDELMHLYGDAIPNLQERLREPAPDDVGVLHLLTSNGLSPGLMAASEGRWNGLEISNIQTLDISDMQRASSVAHELAKQGEAFTYLTPSARQAVMLSLNRDSVTVAHEVAASGYEFARDEKTFATEFVFLAARDKQGSTVAHVQARNVGRVPNACLTWQDNSDVTVAHVLARHHGLENLPRSYHKLKDNIGMLPGHYAAMGGQINSIPYDEMEWSSDGGTTIGAMVRRQIESVPVSNADETAILNLPENGNRGRWLQMERRRRRKAGLFTSPPPRPGHGTFVAWRDMSREQLNWAYRWHRNFGPQPSPKSFEEFLEQGDINQPYYDSVGRRIG